MKQNTSRIRLVAVVATAVLSLGIAGAWDRLSGGTTAAEAPVKFASSMPAGALVYLESRNLEGLLKAWLASPVRDRYFKSASYRSFTRSRLYLKIQDRLNDLKAGFGVELSDEWLAQVAGGPSAISIYDPSKLEMLFVTEVPREKALASTIFAQAKDFQERKTAKGTSYYSREVTTDGGNGSQRIAFAWTDGKLWIGTSDALLAEALDGPANGGLGAAVLQTTQAATDLVPHDMIVWFDMERSVRNKYFNLYWIQRNAKDLEGLSSGVIDLEFAADGVHERRWYLRKSGAPAPEATDAAALARLEAAAPADAQLVEATTGAADLGGELAATMFGPERAADGVRAVQASNSGSSYDSSEDDSESSSASRFRYLDERFDHDVDDPSVAFALPVQKAVETKTPTFAEQVSTLVGAAAPVRTAIYASIGLADKELFAHVDRVVVVELGAPDRLNTADLERLVRAEFARRFVVGGDVERVAWAVSGGSRSLAGSLTSQGGAYRVAGKYLVVSSTAASCDAVATRLAQPAPAGAAGGRETGLVRVAEVRLSLARGPFQRLTRILDTRQTQSVEEEAVNEDSEEGDQADNRPVLFFSQNLASLLDVVRDVTRVRLVTAVDGQVIRESVDYVWAAPAVAKAPAAAAAPPK